MRNTVTHLKTKPQRWAEKITVAYGDSVQAIVEVGRQLQQAKADCTHGEWGELTGKTTGKPMLPFSYTTAFRIKAIAGNAALSNGAHGQHLPASWRTLAVLANLDPDDIEAAIADGDIHPGMERKDAEALKSRLTGKPTQKPKQPERAPVVPIGDLDLSHVGPPMTDEERAYVDKAPERIGQMLADFAARTADQERAADEIAARFPDDDDTAKAEQLGLDVLAGLRELANRIDRAATSPMLIDEHRRQAIAHLGSIRAHIARRT